MGRGWRVGSAALLLVLGGCAGPRADDENAPTAGAPAWTAQVSQLPNLGAFSAEPTVAVWGEGRGRHVAVANIEYFQNPLHTEDKRFILATHVSEDDGETWRSTLVPRTVFQPFDPAGTYTYMGDPVLAFTQAGELVQGGVAVQGVWKNGVLTTLLNAVAFITTSTDQGATWSPAVFFSASVGALGAALGSGGLPAGTFNDRVALAIAPDGVSLFCWTMFVESQTVLWCTRGTHAKEWVAPAMITRSDPGRLVTGISLAMPGSDHVYLAAADAAVVGLAAPSAERVWLSRDKGVTFTAASSPGPADSFAHGNLVADPSDPSHLFYVGVQGQPLRVYRSESTDSAASWSAPRFVTGDGGGQQLHPAGLVDAQGRLRYVFYDGDAPDGERLAFHAMAPDGALHSTWLGNVTSPGAYRRDYIGIAGSTDSWAAWVGGDGATKTWIEVARVSPP